MAKAAVISTKLPIGLIQTLDKICLQLGLRKTYVIESALKEKLEDLIDTNDLSESIKEASGFHSLDEVKTSLKKKGKF